MMFEVSVAPRLCSEDVFSSFLRARAEEMGEPAWLLDVRRRAFANLAGPPRISYRRGLGIVVTPKKDPHRALEVVPNPSSAIRVEAGEGVLSFRGRSLQEVPSSVREEVMNALNTRSDPFDLFHLAYASDVHVLVLPEGRRCGKPVSVSVRTGSDALFCTHLIVASGESTANVQFTLEGKGYLSQEVIVLAKEQDCVGVATLQRMGSGSYARSKTLGVAQEKSRLAISEFVFGGGFVRSDCEVKLAGKGAQAFLTTLFLGGGDERRDVGARVMHEAPGTKANIVARGVLSGRARGLSRGLIGIGEGATGADGRQKQDILLLSDGAEAFAVPDLEIRNNEVACSHATGIGQLDEEQLFYLRSRGLSRKEASKLLIKGYFKPVLDSFACCAQPERVAEELDSRLEAVLEGGV
ncbi:SufD family Fe-S cluster assembly protein [Candidatus Woesearchaeota archaeon]|nr:MAG: SufD family Fe-S cluster assembly protein [Candidatus Woesearchaeota archaeon]